ncbi:helix-turn-helix domain-containing protein [Solwaraspora sp. WMMA2101]|uniref:helix-turn-helix domain-containing protein n=1 Tax=Solwaraspora sp. WMMA2101 TaxID=3404124 RepID=UPI003B957D4A
MSEGRVDQESPINDLLQVRRGLGRRLAVLRQAAGHTQHQLSRLIHYHRSSVANVETGRQRAPRDFWQRADKLLGAGGDLLAAFDRVESQHRQHKVDQMASRFPPETIPEVSPEFGQGAAVRSIVQAAHETREHALNAGALTVSDVAIEQLRDDVSRLARRFPELELQQIVGETLRIRDLAVRLLEHTRRPAQQTELYLIVAQAAALLASESVDLGLWSPAMQYARAAYAYGEIVGHAGACAYARGMQATIAYWTGQVDDAVHYAQAAADLAPAGVARVRAYSVLARALAYRGDAGAVVSAIAIAADARSQAGRDELHDVVGGEFGFTIEQQARCDGTALLQVGQVGQATDAARRALDLAAAIRAQWPTVVAEARVDLAACLLLGGQLDAVEPTLAPVWAMPPQWRRAGLIGRIDRLRGSLNDRRWRGSSIARSTVDRAAAFVAVRPELPALPGV